MPANAEAAVIDMLSRRGFDAYGDVPHDRPDEFVTVERVGGSVDDILDRGMFAIQCWSTTRLSASELCSGVCDAISSMRFDTRVASSKVNSAYNYPDTRGGIPRYQITAEITLMRH